MNATAPTARLSDVRTLPSVRGVDQKAPDASDEALFERARGGDAAALERLLEHYLPHLHAFVRVRLDAVVRARESSMDVVQSVCRELLGARPRFEFRGEDRFRAWLFTSALNKIMEKQRFHRFEKRDPERESPLPEADDDDVVANLLTPSLCAIGKETAHAITAAMDALDPQHREVIALARVVRLPHQVIAEVMGRSEAAVRQLLARAVLRLSEELRRRGVDLTS
jgi:RNA polymerase sigma-70 factor (ECF subfamily)